MATVLVTKKKTKTRFGVFILKHTSQRCKILSRNMLPSTVEAKQWETKQWSSQPFGDPTGKKTPYCGS